MLAHLGYPGLFLLLALGVFGAPIPDESLLAFAGVMAAKGEMSLPLTLLSGTAGTLGGITTSYLVGRFLGPWFIARFGRRLRISHERLERSHAWFRKMGRWSLSISPFVPGLRHLAAFAAGTSRLRYRPFAIFGYMGGLVWSTSLILSGFFLGRSPLAAAGPAGPAILGVLGLAGIAGALWYVFRKRKKAGDRTAPGEAAAGG